MTIEEASDRYCIPIDILKEYESMELCDEVKKVMGIWQYDNVDIERLSMIATLYEVGFNKEEIKNYMKLYLSGEDTADQCAKILKSKRHYTLDEIHFKERQLSTIDYLHFEISKMKKQKKNK